MNFKLCFMEYLFDFGDSEIRIYCELVLVLIVCRWMGLSCHLLSQLLSLKIKM